MSSPLFTRYIEYRVQNSNTENAADNAQPNGWKAAYIWTENKVTYLIDDDRNNALVSNYNPLITLPNGKTVQKMGHYCDQAWGWNEILTENGETGFPKDGDPELYNFLTDDAWKTEDNWGPVYKYMYKDTLTGAIVQVKEFDFMRMFKACEENAKRMYMDCKSGDKIKLDSGEIVEAIIEEAPVKYHDFRYNAGYITIATLLAAYNNESKRINKQIIMLKNELEWRKSGEILCKIAEKLDINIKKNAYKTYDSLKEWTISDIKGMIKEYEEMLDDLKGISYEIDRVYDFLEYCAGINRYDIDNDNIRLIYWAS